MLRMSGFLLGSILALLSACQRSEVGRVSAPGVPAAAPVLSGSWHVEGVTVEKDSGRTRQISGTIIMIEEGGRYRSTFDLDTMLPTGGRPTLADVIGEGEGIVAGRELSGTARTQVVISGEPNADPGFAVVPRYVGTRIVSTTKGSLGDDGTISLSIESEPAPGEVYAATRTTLTGTFIGTNQGASASVP